MQASDNLSLITGWSYKAAQIETRAPVRAAQRSGRQPCRMKTTVKQCARCGKALPNEERRTFSTWTRNYYCIEIDACDKRAKKRARATVTA